MNKILRKISLLLIVIFLFSSCIKNKDPLKYSDIFSRSTGKAVSDWGSSVILKPDGTLWSWGKNINGELGHGTEEAISIPTQINSINNIIDFDLSDGMCLAVDTNGNIWGWGSYRYASFEWPKVLSPYKISYLANAHNVYSNCFAFQKNESEKYTYNIGFIIRNDRTLWKIEKDPPAPIPFFSAPKRIDGMSNIKSISGFNANALFALRHDGTLLDLMPSKRDPEWGGFVAVQDVAEVQNSITHTVILKKDGTVWAWGQNSIGELGNGTWDQSAEPVRAKNLDHVIQISTNYHFNLALKDDGSVWFWGSTALRDENNKPVGTNVPVRVDDLNDVIYVYANDECMAIKKDGTFWSFKVNDRIAQEINVL